MKKLMLISLVGIQSYSCFGAEVKKFVGYDNDTYQVTMEDRFDVAAIKESGIDVSITDIKDFRCPPRLPSCHFDGGVYITGKLNGVDFELNYREDTVKKEHIKVTNVDLEFSHMVGGFYDEPYVFDLKCRY